MFVPTKRTERRAVTDDNEEMIKGEKKNIKRS